MEIPNELKLEAKEDMKNLDGEIGFSEGFINGVLFVITAKKVGFNKPGRTSHTRYNITKKPV